MQFLQKQNIIKIWNYEENIKNMLSLVVLGFIILSWLC